MYTTDILLVVLSYLVCGERGGGGEGGRGCITCSTYHPLLFSRECVHLALLIVLSYTEFSGSGMYSRKY